MASNVSIVALLKPTGISHAEFLQWNPGFNPKVRDIPVGYRVKAPSEKLASLAAAYRRITGSAPAPSAPAAIVAISKSSLKLVFHHVTPGETLSKIARNYRVSVDAIQQANGMGSGHRIAAGQQLKIPKKA